jgi:phage baseplate assembly protein W
MAKVEIPHFDVPFRFEGGKARVVEQDTLDEHVACVRALLAFPLGFRAELPEFGVTDLLFKKQASRGGTEELRAAIAQWEPRADVLITDQPDLMDDMVREVGIEVRGVNND